MHFDSDAGTSLAKPFNRFSLKQKSDFSKATQLQRTTMKMESNYEPVTGRLDLSYDAEAQKVFARAAKKVTPLFDFHSSPLRRFLGEEADEDVGAPLRLLADLGVAASRTLQVTPMAMQSLLNLSCWLTLCLGEDDQSVKPLDRVVILLSNVTPMPVLPVDLPPACEVFDEKTTNPAVRKAYESLRAWDRNTTPHLYAIQMFFLWQNLKRLSHLTSSLETLMASLDASIGLLRLTFETLALREISSCPSKRKTK